MSERFIAANMINKASRQLKELRDTLDLIERDLDREVEALSGPRAELEEVLQAGDVEPGLANQLWSRLGKFDRHNMQMYARVQNAVERAIEASAHLTDANYHNAMCHDECDAFKSAIEMLNARKPEGQNGE